MQKMQSEWLSESSFSRNNERERVENLKEWNDHKWMQTGTEEDQVLRSSTTQRNAGVRSIFNSFVIMDGMVPLNLHQGRIVLVVCCSSMKWNIHNYLRNHNHPLSLAGWPMAESWDDARKIGSLLVDESLLIDSISPCLRILWAFIIP